MRISIIGHSGSGKTILANKISKKLNIPYMEIDRLWFESRGNKVNGNNEDEKNKVRSYMKEKVLNFIEQDSWVSDGWYSKLQPFISEKADLIIFLDISLYRRLFNHLKRIFGKDKHRELTKWDDIKHFYSIVRGHLIMDKNIRDFANKYSDKVKIFKNYKELEKFVESL
ncbi:MAG: hypothetical protein WCO35_00350 [Candidatus Nomurabacteria bacterium]